MGFFREGAEVLWHEVIEWLDDAAPTSTSTGEALVTQAAGDA
jgi:hypothetical protein